MTRRARGFGAPSRIGIALLLVALAFGAAMAGGYDPVYAQTVDYDDDNDGLIDVRSLAQLDAIRHDLNGDGDVATGAPTTAYNAAFPNRVTTSSGRMGCPSGNCTGYELRAHLDFDTDGDGVTYIGTGSSASGDSGDDYYNSGAGWAPLGQLESTFKGNGFTISNLFIKRETTDDVGLFTSIGGSGRVESLGVHDAFVHGQRWVGALASSNNNGTVAASWSSGAVRGDRTVGGLIGSNNGTSRIIASYSTASAHAETPDPSSGAALGGLAGYNAENASVTASYAAGAVTSTSGAFHLGGLVGENDAGTVTNSYWDIAATGIYPPGVGSGQSTAALQTPTGYAGIYANWNVDVDGTTGGDDPWDFGTSTEYPALKYGGMDPDFPARRRRLRHRQRRADRDNHARPAERRPPRPGRQRRPRVRRGRDRIQRRLPHPHNRRRDAHGLPLRDMLRLRARRRSRLRHRRRRLHLHRNGRRRRGRLRRRVLQLRRGLGSAWRTRLHLQGQRIHHLQPVHQARVDGRRRAVQLDRRIRARRIPGPPKRLRSRAALGGRRRGPQQRRDDCRVFGAAGRFSATEPLAA